MVIMSYDMTVDHASSPPLVVFLLKDCKLR